MRIWNDTKERALIILTAISLFLWAASEIRPSVICSLKDTVAEQVLSSNTLKNIVSGLSAGIVSAYIFYVFIDLIPRNRKERKIKELLSTLIASILDSHKRCKVFGHETSLSNINKDCLEQHWLISEIEKLKTNESNFSSLKFSMQTAHSRLDDFRNTLPLAISLSPDHALRWLELTDKVRLLAENYEKQPEIPIENIDLLESTGNPAGDYKSTLNFRLLELIEQSLIWLYPENHTHG